MLEELQDRRGGSPAAPIEAVIGDALRPPFARRQFGEVLAMGNLLGFAGPESDRLLDTLLELTAPGGRLLLEIAPGAGERSRYLHRLPPSSVGRLLRAPTGVVIARVEREGFDVEPRRRKEEGEFRRVDPAALAGRLRAHGHRIEETVAVAPALGPEAARVGEAARDPKSWAHLLEIEETLGRSPDRTASAAAVLVAVVVGDELAPPTGPPKRRIK